MKYFLPKADSRRAVDSSNIFFSETTGPFGAKHHMDPQWIGGMQVYLPHLGHMTKMAAHIW